MEEPKRNPRGSSGRHGPDSQGASEHLRHAMSLSRRKAMTWTFVHVIVPWFVLLAATLGAWGAWRDDVQAPDTDPRIDEVLEVVKRNQGKIMMLQQQLRGFAPPKVLPDLEEK